MEQAPVKGRFAFRIGRSLRTATAIVVVAVLLTAGTTLALASRILGNNDVVSHEYDHLLRLDAVHTLFDDLIIELHQIDATGRHDRSAEALVMQEELARRLDELAAGYRDATEAEQPPGRQPALESFGRLSLEGRALAERLSDGGGGLTADDLEWLNRATHEVPRRVDELGHVHRSRIASRLRASRDLLELIVALFVVLMVGGAGIVFAAGYVATRRLSLPLHRLAAAAREIADGRLDARVRVVSANEIGQLAVAFNSMAERLQANQGQLARVNRELRDKIRETQALYGIGTEIARLSQLDRILQSVVDKARELLAGDAAALCLFGGPGQEPVAHATSGPPEAFRPADGPVRCEPAAECGGCCPKSPLVQPGWARAQLSAALQLGGERLGALHVTARQEREFSPAEAELLAGLATQAAVAIERTRLAAEVRSLAAAEEWERLAREMHDGLAQSLGLLHLKLQGALARRADQPAIAAELREMARITAAAYEDVRQSIFGLRTFVSRGLGLLATLTEYLGEFSAHNGLQVEIAAPGTPIGRVPPATEVQAVRIIQEALTNVRKHAGASRALVRLQRDGGWLRVSVEDDGAGWDPDAAHGRLHFGLRMMRERAEGLGGRLEVDTAPGQGTRLAAILPAGPV